MQSKAVNKRENTLNYYELLQKLCYVLDCCSDLIKSSTTTLRIFPVQQNIHNNNLEPELTIRCNEVLQIISHQLQLISPQFYPSLPKNASSLEVALSKFCGLTVQDWSVLAAHEKIGSLQDHFDIKASKVNFSINKLQSVHLPEFKIFSQGVPAAEAILLIPPCAVPIRLFQPWLDILSKRYFVLTIENPFLFGAWRSLPEPSGDIYTEVDYIGAVLEKYNITHAHLLGICGGAPIALAAAAKFNAQTASVFICHGDLNFGQDTLRTPFQEQFQGLLSDSANSIQHAQEAHTLLLDPALLATVPSQLGPFILYPYANFDLFRRYAKINSSLMKFDATQSVAKLKQPLMIFTSRDDRMTHPAASFILHKKVPHSQLLERETGNHQDILLGSQELFGSILQFINQSNAFREQ